MVFNVSDLTEKCIFCVDAAVEHPVVVSTYEKSLHLEIKQWVSKIVIILKQILDNKNKSKSRMVYEDISKRQGKIIKVANRECRDIYYVHVKHGWTWFKRVFTIH